MVKLYVTRTQQNLKSVTIPSVSLFCPLCSPQVMNFPWRWEGNIRRLSRGAALRLPAAHPGQALVHLLPVTASNVIREGHEVVPRVKQDVRQSAFTARAATHCSRLPGEGAPQQRWWWRLGGLLPPGFMSSPARAKCLGCAFAA